MGEKRLSPQCGPLHPSHIRPPGERFQLSHHAEPGAEPRHGWSGLVRHNRHQRAHSVRLRVLHLVLLSPRKGGRATAAPELVARHWHPAQTFLDAHASMCAWLCLREYIYQYRRRFLVRMVLWRRPRPRRPNLIVGSLCGVNRQVFFYADNRSASNRIVPILSSALVPVVGVVLELPPIQTSHVLLSSFVLMVIGHAGLLFPIFGVLLPLSCLGTAFAAFGVSFWGAVLGCLVGADDAIPVPQDDDSDRLPRMGEAGEIGTDPDLESVDFRGQSGIDRSQFSALGIGLVTSVLNAVGAISPLILAAIKNVLGYFGVELAYGFLAAFGSAICLGLS